MTNEDMHLELGQLITGLKSLKDEVVTMRKDLGERIESMESEVKSLTEFKNNGKGILLGVSFAAGGFGAAFKVFWDYLRGHGL